jgi:hypothetical protein
MLWIGSALWRLQGQDQSRFRGCTLRETQVLLPNQLLGSCSPVGGHFPRHLSCKATVEFLCGGDCVEIRGPLGAVLMWAETCLYDESEKVRL